MSTKIMNEVNKYKLLERVRKCELYEKDWGSGYARYSMLSILCRLPGHRNHSISTCVRCQYLPKENNPIVS